MRLADDAEQAALDVVLDQLAHLVFGKPRALATRGTWKRRRPA